MNKTMLRKYAKLVVRMGANVKKGQKVIVAAETDQSEFALLVADEAYKAGKEARRDPLVEPAALEAPPQKGFAQDALHSG